MESARTPSGGGEHVLARNYGWQLFNCIPLFRSDITMKRVQEAMSEEAAKQGATVSDIVYHNNDTVMFEIPIIGFTIPIPYVVCYKEIQVSGVLE